MADEALVAAPAEQATPAIESVATPDVPAAEPEAIPSPGDVAEQAEAEQLAAEAAAQQAEDDLEDVEWEGRTFKAPKGVKDGILRNADYTQKTQSLSADRKALAARLAEVEQQAEVTEAELRDRAVKLQIDGQLEQYKNVDWVALWRNDPVAAGEHQARYQQLQQAAQDTDASLKAKQAERTQKAERELATRVEETLNYASKKIPNFKPEMITPIVEFAEKLGIPEDTIKRNWSPTFFEVLRLAHIGNVSLQKPTSLPQKPPIAPLATVGGKTAPVMKSDLESADMETFIALRKKGVGGPSALR